MNYFGELVNLGNGIFAFSEDRSFTIRTPKNIIVRVFAPLACNVTGILRLDQHVKCVNPWKSATKYIQHMSARGWTIESVHQMLAQGHSVVVVSMERSLWKA